MKPIRIDELSVQLFLPFGFYARLTEPGGEYLGAPPVTFFRDMLQMDLGASTIPSFSICRVEKRPFEINMYEYHSKTGEGILPLDNDVLIHVVPATRSADRVPVEKLRVFRVPVGTMIVLRPGVWHHAPFTLGDNAAHVLIVLPERTYANDCIIKRIDKGNEVTITLSKEDKS